MMKTSLLFAALISMSTVSQAALVNDIINGDFESAWDPATSPHTGYIYLPDDTNAGLGWDFNVGAGLTQNNTAWGGADDDGSQFAFIQGLDASISQSFVLSASQAVTLSYDWALRPGNADLQQLQITLNGQVLSASTIDTTDWTAESLFLGNLLAGTYTLSFLGQPIGPGDVTVYLDDVVLSAIDVSSLGAFGLFGGLVLLGGIKKRQVKAKRIDKRIH
jgi:hypothetical protein